MVASTGYGRRFSFHDWPAGQKGGLMLYPVSGVLEGLACSTTANLAADGSTYQIQVTPGRAKLDGTEVQLSTALTATLALTPTPTTGLNRYSLYLNPQRQIPAVVQGSSYPSNPAVGDRVLLVVDEGSWQKLVEIQEWNGSAWVRIHPIHGPSEPVPGFSLGYAALPAGLDSHNNLPLNNVRPGAVTAAQLSLLPEKPIYHDSGLPPSAPAHSLHWLRQSAALELCRFEIEVVVFPLTLLGTSTAGSNTLTGDFRVLLGLPSAVLQAVQVSGPGLSGNAYINTLAADGLSLTLDNTPGAGGTAVNAGSGAGTGWFTFSHSQSHHLVAHRLLPGAPQRLLA